MLHEARSLHVRVLTPHRTCWPASPLDAASIGDRRVQGSRDERASMFRLTATTVRVEAALGACTQSGATTEAGLTDPSLPTIPLSLAQGQ